jgi:hypothetical protein
MLIKCKFCPRTFSNRTAYSQHVRYCMTPEVSSSSEESSSTNDINDISDMSLNDQNIEINESDQNMSISEDSDQSILISGGDRSMSISDDGDRSLLISETNSDKDEDILEDILEESEPEINPNYPNEAYGDLMALVTKHKLNNKAGDAIIKFFNKHANLTTSPLPKSIKQGRVYMDNMNLPSLTYKKTCVMNYNNKEYYLHHRSLLNCIRNILSIPDISQNFTLTFENLEVIISHPVMHIHILDPSYFYTNKYFFH